MSDADWIKGLLGALASLIAFCFAWVRVTTMDNAKKLNEYAARLKVLESRKVLTESDVRHIVQEETVPLSRKLDANTEVLTEVRIATGVLVRLAQHEEATKKAVRVEVEGVVSGLK